MDNPYLIFGVLVRTLSVFMLMFIIAPAAFIQWFFGRSDTRMWLKRKRLALWAGFGSAAVLCVPSIINQYLQSVGIVSQDLKNLANVSGTLALFILVLTITSFYWTPYLDMLRTLFKRK